MAVAYVRDAGLKVVAAFSGTNNESGSFSSLPAVGNHVFVGVSLFSGFSDSGMNIVWDNQGNTYAEDIEKQENTIDTGGKSSSTIDSCKVTTSSGTFTIYLNTENDGSGNNYIAWTAVEFSWIDATTWFDKSGSASLATGDANVTADSANATAAGVAIGVAVISNDDTDINIGDTPPSGYTNIQVNENSNGYVGFSMVYKIYSSSETSSAQWTHDNTSQNLWAAVIGTYKAAGGTEITVNKSETIGSSENAAVVLANALAISVSDAVSVSESVGVAFPGTAYAVNVSDNISVLEYVSILPNIYYKVQQTTDVTVATASPVVTAPSGISDGDLIVIVFATNTGANVAVSAGGFTRLGTEVDSGTDTTTGVLYKMASGEGANWTLTNLFDATEIGRFVVLVYGYVNPSPININAQGDLGTVTTATGPSITTTTAPTMVVQFIGTDPATGAYQASPDSSPVGTERFDGKDGLNNAYIAVQEYWNTAIGAIALDMTALTSDTYGGHQFAIQAKITPFKNESITVGESVAASIGIVTHNVNVSETIGTTEAVAASLPTALSVNKSDNLSVAETVSASLPVTSLSISVSDEVTVFEPTFTGFSDLSVPVSESVSLTEAITVSFSSGLSISKSEAVSVSDSVAVIVSSSQVNKSDSVSVAETVSTAIVTEANKSETVTVAETVGAVVSTLQITVSDGISITDTPTINLPIAGTYTVNVNEAVSVTESKAVSLPNAMAITVTEAVGVTESKAVLLPNAMAVTVTEAVGVTDTPNVSVTVLGTYTVNVSDAVGVTESTAASLPNAMDVTVIEAVGVTESKAVSLPNAMAVTVTDAVGVTGTPSVSITAFGTYTVNVSDAVGVTESKAASLPNAMDVTVTEAVGVTDTPNVSITAFGTYTVNVSDAVGVTDMPELMYIGGFLRIPKKQRGTLADWDEPITGIRPSKRWRRIG